MEPGSGIGRVTSALLKDEFENIDILDQTERFIKMKVNIPNIRNAYNLRFEDMSLDAKLSYDCVWIQWLLMYLTDDQIQSVLKKCVNSLSPSDSNGKSGLIFVKEVVVPDGCCVKEQKDIKLGVCVLNKKDYYIMRSRDHYEQIFLSVGLQIVHSDK